MKVLVTGRGGFIGRHLVSMLEQRGHLLVEERPQAVIHLAWAGLPNYESPAHRDNVDWQSRFLADCGCRNVTIPGTCWETCEQPPAYARAKTELWERLQALPMTLKWVRAPYLYGHWQNRNSLLPSLRHALHRGDTEFHVVPGSLPFLPVSVFCERLITAMTDERPHIANIPGVVENVADFCRRQIHPSTINLIPDYPRRPWEL